MRRILFPFLGVILGMAALFLMTAMLGRGRSVHGALEIPATQMNIIDLGTLGGRSSEAADLNDVGSVVGTSLLADGQESGYRWSANALKGLDNGVNPASRAYAINDKGIIAGSVLSGGGASLQEWPALWENDVYVALPLFDGQQAAARDINDSGTVAGHTFVDSANHILLWQRGVLSQTIPVPDGVAVVNAINDEGQIVGLIHEGASNSAFLWQENAFTDLGTLGGQSSIAYDINNAGAIVGGASTASNAAIHAFLLQDGIKTDLNLPGSVISGTSRALGINDLGVIVGEAQVGEAMHAVMWVGEHVIDLNDYLPQGSTWEVLRRAVSINDLGWITGTGIKEGEERAFLLEPLERVYQVFLPVVASAWQAPIPIPTPVATPPPTATPSPSPTPPTTGYDLRKFMTGDGRLYEVAFFEGGEFKTQARHQTQFAEFFRFYHTKGNETLAEWEEIWSDNHYVYRGTDTSPGNGLYYTLYESREQFLADNPGSRWAYRFMKPGDLYFRQPYVVFFRKSDCGVVIGGEYTDKSWLRFLAFHPRYRFDNGYVVDNVIELTWLPGSESGPSQFVDERYFYAEDYGLVGWKKPSLSYFSAINEEHALGARPDNKREFIPCLGQQREMHQLWDSNLLSGPLPEPYARLVRPGLLMGP